MGGAIPRPFRSKAAAQPPIVQLAAASGGYDAIFNNKAKEADTRGAALSRRKTTQSRADSSAASTLGGTASDSSLVFKKLLGQ
jgi:hypothetical protein